MELSSAFCRAQAASQRERAAATTLDNVRVLAGNAAVVWDRAALAAEDREARREKRYALARVAALCEEKPPQAADEALGETP